MRAAVVDQPEQFDAAVLPAAQGGDEAGGLRPVADHHFAAGQVQAEEGGDVLLHRYAADE